MFFNCTNGYNFLFNNFVYLVNQHKMKGIAILYQAILPPVNNGIQKPMKLGGYADSGADIAYELQKNGILLITPSQNPKTENDLDWVFPDTKEGIQLALDKGAEIFWLNTVLYKNHPIEDFFDQNIEIIGQSPKNVDVFDDKLVTNALLKDNGLSIPKTTLILKENLINYKLTIEFPLVVKPIRGRGSQGVSRVYNKIELDKELRKLFAEKKYGTSIYVEKYLPGQEITITVMPPGKYQLNSKTKQIDKHWSLPALKRFNHKNGIAPYNGVVAVVSNSKVLDDEELNSEKIKKSYQHCEKAAKLIDAKAPIRIDCRANENGDYFLFDLNMKPNMTGASRPHRKNQDSLSALAARKIGWCYKDLLINIIAQKWKPD